MQVVAEKGRHREQVHSKRMAIINQLRFEIQKICETYILNLTKFYNLILHEYPYFKLDNYIYTLRTASVTPSHLFESSQFMSAQYIDSL